MLKLFDFKKFQKNEQNNFIRKKTYWKTTVIRF